MAVMGSTPSPTAQPLSFGWRAGPDMHVEQARSGLADGFDYVGARARSMPDIDADTATRVHVLHDAESALRGGKCLSSGPWL